jgi:hypothetical protein
MKRTVAGFCLLLILTCTTSASEWHGITPLRSTRIDVLRAIGAPAFEDYVFDVEEGRATIRFSVQPCEQSVTDKLASWRVSGDTVLDIALFLKKPVPVAELNLTEAEGYQTEQDDTGVVNYRNSKEGVVYTAADGVVFSVLYGPSEKDGHLRCVEETQAERQ